MFAVAVIAFSSILDNSLHKSMSSMPVNSFMDKQVASIPNDLAIVSLEFIIALTVLF